MMGRPPPLQRTGERAARRSHRAGPMWWLVTGVAVAMGFCTARAIPPWHPDGAWWGTFFTSAGFGGSLAVIGAGAASCVALHNSSRDREQKRAADDLARWWDRFAWACEKAVSEEESESGMGIIVLTSLIGARWTRIEDADMTVEVVNIITRAAPPRQEERRP